MDTLQRISSITDTGIPTYDFFFNRVDYCLSKGKGFSVFNADDRSIISFSEQCSRKGFSPLTVNLSFIKDALTNIPDSPIFVTLIQDLPYSEFLGWAPRIAEKLVSPRWV